MSISRFVTPFSTALDTAGVTLPGARLYFYISGTATPQNTYSDAALTIPNTNPVVSDAGGLFSDIYLSEAASYKVVLTDEDGNQVWTADPVEIGTPSAAVQSTITNIAALRTASVATGLVGLLVYVRGYYSDNDGGEGFFRVTNSSPGADNSGTIIWSNTTGFYYVRQIFDAPLNVKWFGAKGDGATDDSVAIQTTINTVNAVGGGIVVFPASTYRHTASLTLYNNIQYIGAGYDCCQLNYTGTSDQAVISNPINSSTVANINIFGLYFNGPNIVTPHACLFDTGSSLVTIEQCYFWGGYFGLELNQSELWSIRDTYFNGNYGVWLLNGADRTGGANQVFTNRISFDGCQFNVNFIHVVDDGGAAHSFTNCNINAGQVWMRVAGCYNLYVSGCEMESPSVAGVQFRSTRFNGGSVPNWTGTATFVGNELTGNAVESFNIDVSSVRQLILLGNLFDNANTVYNGTANNPDALVAMGNHQLFGAESINADALLNNYFDTVTFTPTWTANGTPASLGNGTIFGSYSRRGRTANYFCQLTFGTTTTFGSGEYNFTVPVSPSGSNGQGAVGSAYIVCNGKFYSGSVVYRAPNVQIAVSGFIDVVGSTIPDNWVSGNTIQFTFEFTTANKVA